MEVMEVVKKEEFVPTDKIVMVKPIMRVRNTLITDPDHEAFFLFGTATTKYCLPADRGGNLINPFSSKEEQKWLEKELDLDLNIYKTKENNWKKRRVTLGKDNRKLNLANPKDYIDWLILKANTELIAPNGDSANKRMTYRYMLVEEEFEVKSAVKSSDKKKMAYKAAQKLEDKGRDAMLNLLKVYGHRVSRESKTEFLIASIDKIIEDDIDGFLKIIDEKDYEMKLLIANAVEVGAVVKKGRGYSLPGGDPLCGPGLTATIDNAVAYLNQPANGDIVNMLNAQIAKANKTK